MSENKHTIGDLYQMQALPLSAKIRMTERRIEGWIDEFGIDGVYISFSGGKDSTVLMDIVRNRMGYKNIPAVFVDVPTQYPELKEFALTWDNVEVIKPKISFMQVCKKYGFPLISKEVSNKIGDAKKYVEKLRSEGVDHSKPVAGYFAFGRVIGLEEGQEGFEELKYGFAPLNVGIEYGFLLENTTQKNFTEKKESIYDQSRYKFYLDAKFCISDACCRIMKKTPIHKYERDTNRRGITAMMASESRLRLTQWLKNGCNGFEMKNPKSNPMSFWTEQDILQYIKENNLRICSVYGDIVEDTAGTDDVEGQMTISDIEGFEGMKLFDAEKPPLKTTGCRRTGCMLCGFGCHMKGDDRFLQLKETHPKMYDLLDVVENNGVTFRDAINFTNENGNNINIRL